MNAMPQMQSHWNIPFGPIEKAGGISFVKWHAVERYLERVSTADNRTVGSALKGMENWLRQSQPAWIPNAKVRVRKLLNHHCEAAEYHGFGTVKGGLPAWILVTGQGILLTVHNNDAREFAYAPKSPAKA